MLGQKFNVPNFQRFMGLSYQFNKEILFIRTICGTKYNCITVLKGTF